MAQTNYFNGKYTLNSNFILRRSHFGYTIYNIYTDSASEINLFFYTVLNYFLHNATNLEEIGNTFTRNGVRHNMESIQELINSRPDFAELLTESKNAFKSGNPYKDFNLNQLFEHSPENMDLLITNKCNLKCPHCYRNSTVKNPIGKIQIERFFSLIDEMEEERVRSIKITGGEAFLVPELFDIVEYSSKKRLHVSVLSNGTIPLDNKWLNLLTRKNVSLGISLDGINEISNDRIRGKGSFKKTMRNLERMSEHNIRFALTFSVNIYNHMEVPDIIELAIKLKAYKLNFNFIEESGRALDNKSLYTNKLDVHNIKNTIFQLIQKYSEAPIKIAIADNHGLVNNPEDAQLIKDKNNLIICKAGFSGLAIDASLTAYPCIYGIGGKKEYPVGSLLNRSLKDVWNDSNLDIFRGKITINDLPKCRECNLKNLCNIKYCRLRPIYEGDSLYDTVPFCVKALEEINI